MIIKFYEPERHKLISKISFSQKEVYFKIYYLGLMIIFIYRASEDQNMYDTIRLDIKVYLWYIDNT